MSDVVKANMMNLLTDVFFQYVVQFARGSNDNLCTNNKTHTHTYQWNQVRSLWQDWYYLGCFAWLHVSSVCTLYAFRMQHSKKRDTGGLNATHGLPLAWSQGKWQNRTQTITGRLLTTGTCRAKKQTQFCTSNHKWPSPQAVWKQTHGEAYKLWPPTTYRPKAA